MADPVYILTVAGVEQPLRLGSLSLQSVMNGRDTLSCEIFSELGAYRPDCGDAVELTEDGTPIFGGIISQTDEACADGQVVTNGDIVTRISADSYDLVADRVYITTTIAAGTSLHDVLAALATAGSLSDYGITVDAAEPSGSLADEWELTGEQLSSILNRLYSTFLYPWEIDASRVLRFYDPVSRAAPTNFVDGDGNNLGDIKVTRSRGQYTNRVIVKAGTDKIVTKEDTFTGDGVTDTFTLTYPIQGPIPYVAVGVVGYDTVYVDGLRESLGGLDAASICDWLYDPDTYEITRVGGAPANGATIVVPYDVQFPVSVTAQDAGEIAANGAYTTIIEQPDVYDANVAQALADQALTLGVATKVQVALDTLLPGYVVGSTLTLTVADRDLSGTFMITEISARTEAQCLRRTLTLIGGTNFRGSFRDLLIAWLGGGVAAGSSSSTGSGPTASTGGGYAQPGGASTNVQVNIDGSFYGDDAFEYDPDTETVMIGSGHTPSGSGNLLVGEGHTVN
jgi:hypothetical protein